MNNLERTTYSNSLNGETKMRTTSYSWNCLLNFLSDLASLALFLICVPTSQAQTIEWTRQLGTSAADGSRGISVDTLGNVFITGHTGGALGG